MPLYFSLGLNPYFIIGVAVILTLLITLRIYEEKRNLNERLSQSFYAPKINALEAIGKEVSVLSLDDEKRKLLSPFFGEPELEVELPIGLLIYKDKIEATIKPFIEIKAKAENNLSLWQSKFGGLPYFPKSLQYPTNSKGQAMFLLAQINFSETPQLAPFPETGILQFYISNGSDIYGACFENPAKQEDFKVMYFPEMIEDEKLLVTKFDFLPKPNMLPVEKQSSLSFSLKHAPMPVVDYHFEPTILNIDSKLKYELFNEYQKVYEEHGKLFRSKGHKLGGYPYFTQNDPREFETYKGEEYVLLFQMDTDDQAGIMWGDCGVANFFISEQDLASKNFSRVFYNWDCC